MATYYMSIHIYNADFVATVAIALMTAAMALRTVLVAIIDRAYFILVLPHQLKRSMLAGRYWLHPRKSLCDAI